MILFLLADTCLGAAGEGNGSGQMREQCPYGWVEATYVGLGIELNGLEDIFVLINVCCLRLFTYQQYYSLN